MRVKVPAPWADGHDAARDAEHQENRRASGMGVKCKQCGHLNEACIISFELRNPFGECETLYLLQCDECRMFTLPIANDTWNEKNPVKWYYWGPYTRQQAETISMVFCNCRRNRWCHCETHEAVSEWQYLNGQGRTIFERADLIAKLKAGKEYEDWKNEWEELVLPQPDNA